MARQQSDDELITTLCPTGKAYILSAHETAILNTLAKHCKQSNGVPTARKNGTFAGPPVWPIG